MSGGKLPLRLSLPPLSLTSEAVADGFSFPALSSEPSCMLLSWRLGAISHPNWLQDLTSLSFLSPFHSPHISQLTPIWCKIRMLDIRFTPRALQGFSLQRFERKSNPLGAFFGSSGGEEALAQPPSSLHCSHTHPCPWWLLLGAVTAGRSIAALRN